METAQNLYLLLHRTRKQLAAMGEYSPHLIMTGCWQEEAFKTEVIELIELFRSEHFELNVGLVDFDNGEDGWIPLNPTGKVTIQTGRYLDDDGWHTESKDIEFCADGTVAYVNGRKIASYTISVK